MEHFVLIKKYGFSEVFLSQISQENHLEPARVLSQEKGFYRIITDKGEKLAEVSGKFRFQAVVSSDYPAVGDFVLEEKGLTVGSSQFVYSSQYDEGEVIGTDPAAAPSLNRFCPEKALLSEKQSENHNRSRSLLRTLTLYFCAWH